MKTYQLRKAEDEIIQERSGLRKKYLEYYMHKVYDLCVSTAEKMVELEKGHISSTR